MVNVLHVIVGLSNGGAEGMLTRLIKTQLDMGLAFRHTVISLTDVGVHGVRLRDDCHVDVYELNMHRSHFFYGLLRMIQLMIKLKPDIVQTWMVHSDILGGLTARLLGLNRVIWGIRTTNFLIESKRTQFIRKICARLSYLIPKRIVCAAYASQKDSINSGYCSEKLRVIPNGFDVHALKLKSLNGLKMRSSLGLHENAVIVGCLGRFNPAKDYHNFIRAVAVLLLRFDNLKILMVGRDLTRDNLELMTLIDQTGFSNRFILLGEQEDGAAYLSVMNVFVLSSCTEGFPNVLGEAMAMGLPCVTTDVGDSSHLLGDTGKIVPAQNSVLLADAIAEILNLSDSSRKALGRSAQMRIEKMFSITASAERFATLYEEIMAPAK